MVYEVLAKDVTYHPEAGDLAASGKINCTYDPATDALVPFSLSVSDTAAGFETPVAFAVALSPVEGAAYAGAGTAPAPGDERVQVDWNAPGEGGGGGGCVPLSSKWTIGEPGSPWAYPEPFAEESRARLYGYFIVADYYSPATPDGDTDLLSYLSLRGLAPTTSATDQQYLVDDGDGELRTISSVGLSFGSTTLNGE